MVVIRVKIEVGRENRQAFLEHSKTEVEQVRGFQGCLNYGWYEEANRSGSFLLYEEWASQEDFDAFRTSEFLKQNGAKVFPMLSGKPDSAYFDAQALVAA